MLAVLGDAFMDGGSIAKALASKRLVLVTGKGGVGKSTCAAAIAVAAARDHSNVLLIELGARSVMGDLLGGAAPAHEPSLVAAARLPTLWVAHLEAQRALQEYLLETLKLKSLVRLATENRVLARLWQAAPGVDEMALLSAIYRFTEETNSRGTKRFDVVIVDMPSTGHALSMLGVPRGVLGMIRGSALATRARAIDTMLHDVESTGVCIVTLPEELPVNESVQLAERLENELGMKSSFVVVNAVTPVLFDAAECATINELPTDNRLFATAARRIATVAREAKRIADLRARLVARFVEVRWSDIRQAGLVDAVADTLSHA
ncbi:MAG: ArsA family ATPase [Clostridia bacterium]|nr:ArsA family ATPase [Deltaproteobacteria bacterium]